MAFLRSCISSGYCVQLWTLLMDFFFFLFFSLSSTLRGVFFLACIYFVTSQEPSWCFDFFQRFLSLFLASLSTFSWSRLSFVSLCHPSRDMLPIAVPHLSDKEAATFLAFFNLTPQMSNGICFSQMHQWCFFFLLVLPSLLALCFHEASSLSLARTRDWKTNLVFPANVSFWNCLYIPCLNISLSLSSSFLFEGDQRGYMQK